MYDKINKWVKIMRVLIVDDMKYKQDEVIYALKQKGLEDYEIAESVSDALRYLKQNKFDVMITDLGLPRFKGGFVDNPLEGLDMLMELSYRKIMYVPTIIYSTTNVPREDLMDLRDVFEYPYLGQARDIETLMLLLQIHIDNNKSNVRARINKNSVIDSD